MNNKHNCSDARKCEHSFCSVCETKSSTVPSASRTLRRSAALDAEGEKPHKKPAQGATAIVFSCSSRDVRYLALCAKRALLSSQKNPPDHLDAGNIAGPRGQLAVNGCQWLSPYRSAPQVGWLTCSATNSALHPSQGASTHTGASLTQIDRWRYCGAGHPRHAPSCLACSKHNMASSTPIKHLRRDPHQAISPAPAPGSCSSWHPAWNSARQHAFPSLQGPLQAPLASPLLPGMLFRSTKLATSP